MRPARRKASVILSEGTFYGLGRLFIFMSIHYALIELPSLGNGAAQNMQPAKVAFVL